MIRPTDNNVIKPPLFERLRAGNTPRDYAGKTKPIAIRQGPDGGYIGNKEDTAV